MKIKQAIKAGQALGAVSKTGILKHPVLKMASKYWWFSIPAGLALYGKVRERMENPKQKTKIHLYFSDAADVVGPILTLVSVIELAERLQEQGRLDNAKPAVAAAPAPSQFQAPAGTQEPPAPSLQRASR
ncbi:MAG: hypothetical protein F6K48_02935 [Okeania sp. SIO3H1]|nr:hypothetical protein [Okeania sp. SIO3H1]